MLNHVKVFFFGHGVDSRQLALEMLPVTTALDNAVYAGRRVRDQAQEALDFAITQLRETQELQQGNSGDVALMRLKLRTEISQLVTVKADLSTVSIESSDDAHNVAARVFARLASAAALATGGHQELNIKAQDLLISVREFDGHIKALPKKIYLAAKGGHETSPSKGIWSKANRLKKYAMTKCKRVLGSSSKNQDFASLAGLRSYAKRMEKVAHHRLSHKACTKPTVTPQSNLWVPAHPTQMPTGTERTYGSALSNFRRAIGPSTTAFVRAALLDMIPEKKHSLVHNLDALFKKLATLIAESKNSSLDKILDDDKDKEFAEVFRGALTLLEIFTRLEPIDETAAPDLQAKLHTMLKNEFTSELELVNGLPDDVSIHTLRKTRNAPIAGLMVSALAKKISGARHWVAQPQKLPKGASGFDKFVVEVLPSVRRYLANNTLRKLMLSTATSWPGRFIINRISGPLLRLFGKGLSSTDRKQIVDALPHILKVIQALELNKSGKQDNIRKIIAFIDVLLEGVHGKQPFNTKAFTIKAMEAMQDLLDVIICDTTFVGIKAMGQIH